MIPALAKKFFGKLAMAYLNLSLIVRNQFGLMDDCLVFDGII